jgi:hypothetical protein
MAATFFHIAPRTAATNPYGSSHVWPTDNGICFQVTTHPGNLWLGLALPLKSVGLAVLCHDGFWSFLGLLGLLLALDPFLYLALRRVRLAWIEVRPDGFTIIQNASKPKNAQFFDQRAIASRQVDFETGLTLRYGIHDVLATPPFAIEREFDIFSVQLEQAVSRLWHRQNL